MICAPTQAPTRASASTAPLGAPLVALEVDPTATGELAL
jgi:hypothetical protein